MPKLLVTRSCHDSPTMYLATGIGMRLISYAKSLGWEVMDLFADCPTPTTFTTWAGWQTTTWCPPTSNGKARRTDFESAMNSFKPDVYIGMGHGFDYYASGQNKEPLLAIPGNPADHGEGGYDAVLISWNNVHLTAGKKVYFIGCFTVNDLGPACIQAGCREYYGSKHHASTGNWNSAYDRFPTSENPPSNEMCTLNDPWVECSNDITLATCKAILAGRTPQQVYDDTMARFDYWIDYYGVGGAGHGRPEADAELAWLIEGKGFFTVLGSSVNFTFSKAYQDGAVSLQLG